MVTEGVHVPHRLGASVAMKVDNTCSLGAEDGNFSVLEVEVLKVMAGCKPCAGLFLHTHSEHKSAHHGELRALGFHVIKQELEAWWQIHDSKPLRNPCKFLDLGSGMGQVCALAEVLAGWQATGYGDNLLIRVIAGCRCRS